MADRGTRGPSLIIHSSDEWYGADRMVSELAAVAGGIAAGPLQVWLPEGAAPPDPSLSRVLAERGIDVRHLPLPILRRRSLTPGGMADLLRQVWRTRRTMASVRPAAVVAATTAVVPVLWSLPRGTPSLLYVQEIWRTGERLVLGALSRPADAVLAISRPVAAALPRAQQRRTTVITNAVADSGRPVVDPPAEGPLTYLVASRWNLWKGHEFLLRAWDAAGCPGRLVVLGGPPEAGIGVDVERLAAAVSRPETVQIVGEVDDIAPWLDRCDVLVLPSTNPEPFGLVVIEAFSRARPVIATDHGAPAEVVSPDVGWLVAPDDVAALADLLRGMTRDDAARRGRAAREAFTRHYSIGAWRSAVADLLRGFLPAAPAQRADG